jgi:hypothetical protein
MAHSRLLLFRARAFAPPSAVPSSREPIISLQYDVRSMLSAIHGFPFYCTIVAGAWATPLTGADPHNKQSLCGASERIPVNHELGFERFKG